MGLSNLPPGVSGGAFSTEIQCSCAHNHTWVVPGYTELGATYFADEEMGPFCPECGMADDGEGELTDSEIRSWRSQFGDDRGVLTHRSILEAAVYDRAMLRSEIIEAIYDSNQDQRGYDFASAEAALDAMLIEEDGDLDKVASRVFGD